MHLRHCGRDWSHFKHWRRQLWHASGQDWGRDWGQVMTSSFRSMSRATYSHDITCAFCALITHALHQAWKHLVTLSSRVSYRERQPLQDILDATRFSEMIKCHGLIEGASIRGSMPNDSEGSNVDLRFLVDDVTARDSRLSSECHGRSITDQIDPSEIRDWMRVCQKEEGSDCSHTPNGLDREPTELRLVDVLSKKLGTNMVDEYIALSYAWGGPSAWRKHWKMARASSLMVH